MSSRSEGAALVSVIELPGQSRDIERTPPQDINAEQSVLGGMMLSKDAIADVVESLRGNDFYRPAHQTIFDVVLDLYGRGEPVDAVTVAAELTKRGEIARIGGAPYLHTLISSVPTAANAGYYAKIVAERAILRRLVEAGTRIVQLGYSGIGNEVDDIVDRAQAAIYDVTERRQTDDYSILESLLAADDGRDRGQRSSRRRAYRRADRLRRSRRADQRLAPRPAHRHRRPAGHGQGPCARHAAADSLRLDDDGRGRRRRLVVGC